MTALQSFENVQRKSRGRDTPHPDVCIGSGPKLERSLEHLQEVVLSVGRELYATHFRM
jgi:hypothetical protein